MRKKSTITAIQNEAMNLEKIFGRPLTHFWNTQQNSIRIANRNVLNKLANITFPSSYPTLEYGNSSSIIYLSTIIELNN